MSGPFNIDDAFININNNQTSVDRLNAYQKLVDNAVVYLDFTKDEGHQHSDLSVTRGNATSLIDYTCATTATGQTADGRIVGVAANTPRLVWNNGKAVGLLNEPSATNYAWPSEQFDSTSTNWGYFGTGNITATKVSKYTPLGSGVATEINKTASDDSRLGVTASDGNAQAGDLRTVSIYVAAGTSSIIRINWVNYNGGVAKSVITEFDTASESFLLNPPDAALLHFEKIDSEWYRMFITAAVEDAANTSMRMDATCGINEIGTVFVDGAMISDGYPTSYIPTTTTSAVRDNTDVAASTVPNVAPNRDFSVYVEAQYEEIGDVLQTLFELSNSLGESVRFYRNSVNNVFALQIFDSTANFIVLDKSFFKNGSNKTLVIKTKSTFKVYVNGALAGSAEFSVDFNSFDIFNIGTKRALSAHWRNPIGSVVVTPKSLTDAEAMALTTLEPEA